MNSPTSQTVSAWTEAIASEVAPKDLIGYLRAQYRSRLHQIILAQFIKMQQEGFNRAAMARKIRKRPEIITRLLNGPGNWTLDTVSDLMLAMGGRPATIFESFLDTPKTIGLPNASLDDIFNRFSEDNEERSNITKGPWRKPPQDQEQGELAQPRAPMQKVA